MQIGVPRETRARETRVAATPKTVGQLVGLGYDVAVESGAGERASFSDEAYAAAGASSWYGRGGVGERPSSSRSTPRRRRDRAAATGRRPRLARGAGAQPRRSSRACAAAGVTALAMDAVPRI